ncbi:RNA polymerase sigma-70 factor [Bacteroides helcogenes]|uniref:RNA polymerase, sigma-24 subunit, ECF subfamily n=1 Tax=Bacteroides helcogenes (strain ATCC 35417 / DSM 20613 / JCM 6297 / CCUG 15421 / P 36-108) TaxID=693979 RepID=E6SUU0_BACT6|nr:RNA polymerase sigma-70 factor [Bacteroides helcogenes]ADV44435.1 RNA polymerase, sigma-24 subunit, ECF subfamily [Bacteroides helcogenes P 36-108]MDY5237086.1 RNA polymerase sigma-70 factor [Bacteroides helcogenes]
MDLKKFNQLFSEYQGRFIRFAQTYVRDMAVAEDFVTEALMYYWEKQDSLPGDVNVPAYILVIIKHKCLNYLQHLEVREAASERMKKYAEWELKTRLATLQACDPDELFSAEAQAIVDRTLAGMPKQTREIFIMSRYQNKSYKEIAALTGMTPKGVQFHINKVLQELRVNLKDYLPLFIYLYNSGF